MSYPKTVKLNSGFEIPLCGLGTCATKDPEQIVYDSIKAGIRLFDTALFYKNEEEIGKGLERALADKLCKREELFIITKIWPTHYEKVEETMKSQLKSLRIDYVDLYLLHWPLRVFNEKGEIQRIPTHVLWKDMENLVKKGYTKSIGVSNFSVQILLDMLTYCEIPPAVNEVEFHPYHGRIELLNFCNKFNIKVIAYNSLVSGGYVRDNENYKIFENKTIIELSQKYKKTEGQIILNFAASQGVITIPKSDKVNRVVENYSNLEFRLEEEDLKKLLLLDEGKIFCKDVANPNIDLFKNFNGVFPFA